MAKSMAMLLVGRALQGTAGGGLMQLVTITISDVFSMKSRALFLGLLESVWCLAGAIGPIIGGLFTRYVSWRWIYWLNLPVAGVAFALLSFLLDVHNPRTRMMDGLKAIDWFGSLSILGLTIMLLLGLNFGGETYPWNSPTVLCLIVFGCLMAVPFVYSERKLARYPLMPMKLLHSRSNVACLIIAFFHGGVSSVSYSHEALQD
jgi:MFS family permease